MRKFQKPIAYFFLGCTGLMLSSCFGRFELVRKLYTWNEGVSESRFVQTLLFYALNILPIYGLAGAVDFFILNLVEFWSGSNPLAMHEGEVEEQFYTHNGVQYHMVAMKNTFTMTALDGPHAGDVQVLRFKSDERTWYFENEETSFAMITFEGEQFDHIKTFTPEGYAGTYILNPNADSMAGMYAPLPETFALGH